MLLLLVLSDRPGLAGKTTMLTYIQINAAKPREKAWTLSDSEGLLLQIQPNGSKLWRFKYRFLDKQKTLHLGGWPQATISTSCVMEGLSFGPISGQAEGRKPGCFEAPASIPALRSGDRGCDKSSDSAPPSPRFCQSASVAAFTCRTGDLSSSESAEPWCSLKYAKWPIVWRAGQHAYPGCRP